MFKTLFTTTLLIAGVAQATSANYCGSSRNVPAPIVTDVAWGKMAKFQNRYADFYYRCGSMIGELEYAQSVAKQLLFSQGKGAAADKLISTLIAKAATLPPEDLDVAYPLTMESIRQAAEVAKSLTKITTADRSMPNRMAAQIKYNTAVNLYRIIKKAYTQLDQPYYMNTTRECYGNCVGINMRDRFDNYADGIVDLAKEFLNLQVNSATAQGTDVVEIGMTAASAKAAKKIVLNSVFRRDYSCAIMELHTIQVEAESFLCPGGTGYSSGYFTESLRARLANVQFPTRGCGYGYGHGGSIGHGGYYGPGHKHGKHSHNNTDIDVNVYVNNN